jgi:hypothetical protein
MDPNQEVSELQYTFNIEQFTRTTVSPVLLKTIALTSNKTTLLFL